MTGPSQKRTFATHPAKLSSGSANAVYDRTCTPDYDIVILLAESYRSLGTG